MSGYIVGKEFFEIHMVNREAGRNVKVVCFKPEDKITKIAEFMKDMSGTFSGGQIEFEIHHVVEDDNLTTVADDVVCVMKCPVKVGD